MADRIEDYAIVGDMQSVALINTDGSVDWLCLPRYGTLVGNMPQAFSHVPLVQTALNLSCHAEEHRRGPRDERRSVPG